MKKLLTPILVLTLIVGFSALALGAETSDSQTLTVDVSSNYLITAPTDDPSLTVGPKTSDSASLGILTYKTNDTGASNLDIVVQKGTSKWLGGLEVTFPSSLSPSGDLGLGGVGSKVTIGVSASNSATIISGTGGSAGTETCSLDNVVFSTVEWTEAAVTGPSPDNVKIIYKFLSS